MCLSASVIMGMVGSALSIAQTAAGYVQQQQVAQQSAENAETLLSYQYDALNRRQIEVNEQATLDAFERKRQAMRQAAKMRVAAQGLAGNSIIRGLHDALFQGEYDVSIIDQARENKVANAQARKRGAYLEADAKLDAIDSSLPSGFTQMLGIAGAGLSGYMMGSSMGMQAFPATGAAGTASSSFAPNSLLISDFADGL